MKEEEQEEVVPALPPLPPSLSMSTPPIQVLTVVWNGRLIPKQV
jgi:hypothetical protein